jgi:hypothetical protein
VFLTKLFNFGVKIRNQSEKEFELNPTYFEMLFQYNFLAYDPLFGDHFVIASHLVVMYIVRGLHGAQ